MCALARHSSDTFLACNQTDEDQPMLPNYDDFDYALMGLSDEQRDELFGVSCLLVVLNAHATCFAVQTRWFPFILVFVVFCVCGDFVRLRRRAIFVPFALARFVVCVCVSVCGAQFSLSAVGSATVLQQREQREQCTLQQQQQQQQRQPTVD